MQREPEKTAAYAVSLGQTHRLCGGAINGHAGHPLCRQDMLAGQRGHNRRYGKFGIRREIELELARCRRLMLIVTLLQQLLLRHLQNLSCRNEQGDAM